MNKELFYFALGSLLRYKSKNIFITIIYTLLVMLLSTLFFTQASLKTLHEKAISDIPDIVIQNQKALRYTTIDDKNIDKILEIYGVSNVYARVEGEYNFKQGEHRFKVIGIDSFEEQRVPLLQQLTKKYELTMGSMFISAALSDLFSKYYYKEEFNFLTPELKLKAMKISQVFQAENFEQNYLCVMDKEDAKKILGYGQDEYTDIAIYLSNQNELLGVVSKLQQLYPNGDIITKEDQQTELTMLFDYDSGVFISLFIISLFTFFMIIFDKIGGVSSSEKKEIGIVKALGWRVEDVLQVKFYEAFLLSIFSYFIGVVLAVLYFILINDFYVKDIFANIAGIETSAVLPLEADPVALALVFILSVPIYIAATIIPSWKIAISDPDEVMR